MADPHLIDRIDIGTRTVELVESLGRIDLDNLHDEVETTGGLALWWGDFSARAKRRAADAEFAYKVLRAELGQKKRRELVQRGERVTEGQVEELVLLDPLYQAAYRVYLQTQEDSDKIESAKFTIARKQSTLEAIAPLLYQEEAARRPGRRVGEDPFPPVPRTPLPPHERSSA